MAGWEVTNYDGQAASGLTQESAKTYSSQVHFPQSPAHFRNHALADLEGGCSVIVAANSRREGPETGSRNSRFYRACEELSKPLLARDDIHLASFRVMLLLTS